MRTSRHPMPSNASQEPTLVLGTGGRRMTAFRGFGKTRKILQLAASARPRPGRAAAVLAVLLIVLLIIGWLPWLGIAAAGEPPEFDAAKARALGIRKLEGRHVTLYTDLTADPEVDALPAVFDAAMPQWEDFFQQEAPSDYRVVASLIKEREKFTACGLLYPSVPDFRNGYTLGRHIWFYEQPTAYYRRHLMLHEGTHAYTLHACGATGPSWYFEGLAELLGTHRWEQGKLTLGVSPPSREAAPHWSRVKIVRDEIAAGRPLSLVSVMNYPRRAHLHNVSYGWSWAAASFLHQHPAYTDAFRDMLKETHLPMSRFNSSFFQKVRDRWPLLGAEWQHYVMSLEYGWDVAREAIDARPAAPLPEGGATVSIDAARGWQSTGVLLRQGETYELAARGRFQVDDEPRPWISEPHGVTLRYYDGLPVGLLLGAVHDPTRTPRGLSALCRPMRVGAGVRWQCRRDGVLYLRINESPAQLADNQGAVEVRIRPAPAP